MSETISVRSLVGRYLEHSRILRFGAGAEATYLLGSADLMQRNLDRRVEVLAPVNDPALKARIDEILEILATDNDLAWELQADATWVQPSVAGTRNAHRRLEELALKRARGISAVSELRVRPRSS